MTYTIRSVSNGYVLTNSYGDEFIAKTLLDAAKVAGEYTGDETVTYKKHLGGWDLGEVKATVHRGEKINAIKMLRELYSHKFGLKEAKELVELLGEV